MENKIIDIEVFTFTDTAQVKLEKLGFVESVLENDERGVRTYDILLSHEKFTEVHLCFTEVLDEELFRSFEFKRQIREKLLFKPRIIVRRFVDREDQDRFKSEFNILSVSPVMNQKKVVQQVLHQQYGFIIAHEDWLGEVKPSSSMINAHLQMICLHQKLMETDLLAEDLIEIPYFLVDEKSESSLYFQLRKESACVALVLDHPKINEEIKSMGLPNFQLMGQSYWHIKENPKDFDLLIPQVEE